MTIRTSATATPASRARRRSTPCQRPPALSSRASSVAWFNLVFLVGECKYPLLVEGGPRDIADDPAVGEDDDAVTDADQFGQVRRDEDDTSAGGRQIP